jgi:acyl carrier protein
VVQVWQEPGAARLAAWLVLQPKSKIQNPKSALTDWLRAKLPEYMVPSAFVVLETLPLTPTGKVDRKALPAPERGADASAYVAPGDAVEEKLADIWQEVLQLDRVGVHDNFFALGGHSLLATQVVTRVRETLGVELPLRRMFESPTVFRLARDVWEAQGAREAGSAG